VKARRNYFVVYIQKLRIRKSVIFKIKNWPHNSNFPIFSIRPKNIEIIKTRIFLLKINIFQPKKFFWQNFKNFLASLNFLNGAAVNPSDESHLSSDEDRWKKVEGPEGLKII